jgi:outer membrane protein
MSRFVQRCVSALSFALAALASSAAGADAGAAHAETDPPAPDRGLYVRAGLLYVNLNTSSSEAVLSNVSGPASLSVDNGPIEGSHITLDDKLLPAVLVGYAIEVRGGEIAVETVLAAPVSFELEAGGTLADRSLAPMALGSIPTGIPALGTELGETKALPPIVTAVYRARHGKRVRPYLGAGVSYLFTYGSRITNRVLSDAGDPHLEIGNAWSWVGQAGVDLRIAGRVHVTLDAKYLTGYATSARLEGVQVATPALPLYGTVRVGDVSVEIDVQPVLLTAAAGLSF